MDEPSQPALDPAVRGYYDRSPEENRLHQGASQLEALRTRRLIERHAPRAPAVVLDIGGAAGAYAGWLADRGYAVHLVDPVPRLVDEARRRSAMLSRPLVACDVGDARMLAYPPAFADVVLLLGPLYHLTTASDRAQALAEAARVLKPGGVLFAAAISRWASALDGLARDLFADLAFRAIVDQDLQNGQHRNTTDRVDYFTTAYFHRPDELRAEVADAGLDLAGVYGLEGPSWILPDFDTRWADPRRRADLIRVAEALELEPSVIGASAHLLAIARKPA
jgi:SAM-dependent methyltransferase